MILYSSHNNRMFTLYISILLVISSIACDVITKDEKDSPYNGTWVLDELLDPLLPDEPGAEHKKQTITITNKRIVFIEEFYPKDGSVDKRSQWTFTYTLGNVLSVGHEIDLTTVSAESALLDQSLVDVCNTSGDCVSGQTGIIDWVLDVPKVITNYVFPGWFDIIKIDSSILYIGDGEGSKWYADAMAGTDEFVRYSNFDETRGFIKQ